MKTAPEGLSTGAAAGKCLLALTRQPLRRPGQLKAAAPDSCTRAASAPGERSCIHGKPIAETGQLYFPGYSAMRYPESGRRRPDTGGCGFSAGRGLWCGAALGAGAVAVRRAVGAEGCRCGGLSV